VEFGGHGVGHTDLTRLSPAERRQEIDGSARALAQQLGAKPRAFAAPYGRVNAAVLADVARTYEVAFGTRFDRARRSSPRFDMPRIEMHYFREERRWRDFLRGADAYFAARRTLRAVRHAALAVAGMAGAGERT
jgi:peptidoglycan/xylan/chitin deacetylase (PgdA/CDA1 family)